VLVGFVEDFDELVVMLRWRLGWRSIKGAIYLSTNHYKHPDPLDWPPSLLQRLNESGTVASDQAFVAAAKDQYSEQVTAFGLERLGKEVQALRTLMDDLRGHCDGTDLEHRARRHFMPACRHHCEGQTRIEQCFEKRFDDQHSAEAVRTRANKLREIAGAGAVTHTPLVV
jgi:hypothetical protein